MVGARAGWSQPGSVDLRLEPGEGLVEDHAAAIAVGARMLSPASFLSSTFTGSPVAVKVWSTSIVRVEEVARKVKVRSSSNCFLFFFR